MSNVPPVQNNLMGEAADWKSRLAAEIAEVFFGARFLFLNHQKNRERD